MAKNTSTQIREFVKNSLKSYYDNFQVKLSDIAKKDDVNPTIKLNNDGSVYIYDLGNYDGTNIQNASSLQSIIKDNIVTIVPGANISTQKEDQTLSISALGYIHNQEKNSFAELNSNIATGLHSHAEGSNTQALGDESHAEGNITQALGNYSHAEGNQSIATGLASHTEGELTTASSNFAHAEGLRSQAIGVACHAEGFESIASIENSHAEGFQTKAAGHSAHAEGYLTIASGFASHAEGWESQATQEKAHAEGFKCLANGISSHAEGDHTITKNVGEHASGRYNLSSETQKSTIFSVGNGFSESNRKNVMAATIGGEVFINSVGNYNGKNITTAKSLSTVISEAQAWLQTLQNQKAEIDDSSSTSNKTYSSNKINSLISSMVGLTIEVYQTLPDTGDEHTLYLVERSTTLQENIYDEYLYINNTWELIGSTQIDLNNYYTKNQVDNLIENVSLKAGQNISINDNNEISANGYVFSQRRAGAGTNTEFNILNGTNITSLKIDKSSISYLPSNPLLEYLAGTVINSSNNIIIKPDNKIYLNTETICNDNVTAVAFYQSSDERLKNIKSELNVEDCYKLINDCSTIIYSLKDDDKDQNQIGMIAQQVKEIMPEVVQESNGYYAINYSRLSVVALNLVKNLSERIIELEKDHNKLEELIKRVEKLEK